MLREAYVLTRAQKLFVICSAVFLTALVVAEATASKFFTAFDLPFVLTLFGQEFTRVTMTAGVIAFPVTFIVTDLMNEYYGKRGIRFVTYVGMAMIAFEFLLLKVAIAVPVDPSSPVPQAAFQTVFGNSTSVIIGSMVAYLLGQLADITLFHWLRELTKGKWLWLRATGSTFGSQFIDTFVVLFVAFWIPQNFGWVDAPEPIAIQTVLAITLFNYAYKFLIAIGITPIIYAAHYGMDRYLGHDTAETLRAEAQAEGG